MRISMTLIVSNSLFKPRLLVGMLLFSLMSTNVIFGSVAQADVYKKVDAEGNVTFSDIPDKSAQLVHIAPIATMPAMSQDEITRTLASDPQQSTANINYSIHITSPTPDQTYRYAVDAFSPNVDVKPVMQNGDHLVLLLDGKVSGVNIPADGLNRGQHQFEAKIVSSNGSTLKSQSVTFFVHQTHVAIKHR
jgi:hypothetical protein